jgi:NTE family protein
MHGAYFAFHPDAMGVEQLAQIGRTIRRRGVFPIGLDTLANHALRGELGIET